MADALKSLVVVAGFAAVFEATPGLAQNCASDGSCGYMVCKTPVHISPVSLWGALQPVDGIPFPPERDNTNFVEFATPEVPASRYGSAEPFWMSLEISGSTLYAGIAHGIQIWDLQANPSRPAFVKTVDGPSVYRQWPSGERKQVLSDIAVQGDLVATIGQPTVGVAIFDMIDKFHPRLAYQDGDKQGNQVYAATIGGRAYVFADTHSTVTGETVGLLAYDMTRARDYGNCLDNGGACPGVMVKQISPDNSIQYVDGANNYIVASRSTARGVWIWDVSNVASPVQKLVALTGESVYGVALWQDTGSGKYYLATRHDAEARIYDASCITTANGCTGLGAPIWSKAMFSGTTQYFITFSRSSTAAYLYFGSDQVCGGGGSREFMFDVTNPAGIIDLTPPQTVPFSGVATNYWTWFYRDTPTGFNKTAGRMGKWNGDYFYRAAFSIFDIHKRTTLAPPLTDFAAPAPIYAGVPATFTDTSGGTVTSRLWTFQGGVATLGQGAEGAREPAGAPLLPDSNAMEERGSRVLLGAFGSRAIALTNPSAKPLAVEVRFLPAGPSVVPPVAERFELGPNERRELPGSRWGAGLGAVIIESGQADRRLPRIEAAGIPLLGQREAARAGETWRLTGLAANAAGRTVLLLYNPGDRPARADLLYRSSEGGNGGDGAVLGRLEGLVVAPGQLLAVRPKAHPIGSAAGFGVEVEVRAGRLLAAANIAAPEHR